jgi:hypothetical protein
MALTIAAPFLTISTHNNAVTVAINRFLVEGTQRRYRSRLRHVSSNLHSLYSARFYTVCSLTHDITACHVHAMAEAVSGPSLCAEIWV